MIIKTTSLLLVSMWVNIIPCYEENLCEIQFGILNATIRGTSSSTACLVLLGSWATKFKPIALLFR